MTDDRSQTTAAPPPALTERQLAAARVIQELIDERGYGPSYRELAHELGLCNAGAAFDLVRQLIARGVVDNEGFGHARARSLVLLRRVPPAPECEVELTERGYAELELARQQR